MDYLDMYGNPIEDRGVYVSPAGNILILNRAGEGLTGKSSTGNLIEMILGFTKNLRKIEDPCYEARFILPELEGTVVDEADNIPI